MDGSSFDRLAKRVASGSRTRRSFLHVVAGSMLGGALGAAGLQQGLAKPKHCSHPLQTCTTDTDCCGALPCIEGLCQPVHGRPSGGCPAGCSAGQGCCSNTCTDLSTVTDCGACGHACTTSVANASPTCTSSTCGSACNGGYMPCADGSCVPSSGCCTDAECKSLPDQCHQGVCQSNACVASLQTGFCLIGGTCVAQGPNPSNPCQMCDPSSATGAWSNVAPGTSCGAAAVCNTGTGNFAAEGTSAYTCNRQGACQGGQQFTCGLDTRCDGSGCATSCASNADCVDRAYCDPATNTCRIDQANGTSCSGDSECASTHCVDGYCCDTPCTDQCKACDVASSYGICTPVNGSPHGSRDKCLGDTAHCRGFCNGSDPACFYPGPETNCGKPGVCTNGQPTGVSTCDGNGGCAPSTTAPCAANQSCVTGGRCIPNTCVAHNYECGPLAVDDGTTVDCGLCPECSACDNGTCSVFCE